MIKTKIGERRIPEIAGKPPKTRKEAKLGSSKGFRGNVALLTP